MARARSTVATPRPSEAKPSGRSGRERVRVTVYLDESLATWGKQQEGGLSELLRNLLTEARQQEGAPAHHYPPEMMEPYRRLIGKKLAEGLTPAEERALAEIRERMNAHDRALPSWKRSETIAASVDRELAELRALIESHPLKTTAS